VKYNLNNVFHNVTLGKFETPDATEPFAGDPFDDGGQDPEAEERAHQALMACRERLVAGWDPTLIKSWSRQSVGETALSASMHEQSEHITGE